MPEITAKDIAHAAGVSQAAVSRAFNPTASIKPGKREMILKVAREMGYEPPALRSLTEAGSGAIALIAADLDNPFYPVAADMLAKALFKRGWHLILYTVPQGQTVDDVLRNVLKFKPEAAIVASATLSSSVVAACRRQGMPIILFNRTQHDPNATAVVCDNYAGGRMIARRFLEQGRCRIAFIGGVQDTSTHRERLRGFEDALAEAGASVFAQTNGRFSYQGGRSAARDLLHQSHRPDAIFAANDVMALATIDVARTLGLSIPDELAIIGFDDIPMASWESYRLTTVRQPTERMVTDALELIDMQLSDRSIEGTVRTSPVRLVLRDSG